MSEFDNEVEAAQRLLSQCHERAGDFTGRRLRGGRLALVAD